jgi:UDP-galactose transporter B1
MRGILLGYGLLVVSLLFDGLMALKEKIINHEVHHNPEHAVFKNRLSWEYMNLFSIYSIVFCGAALTYEFFTGDLKSAIFNYLSNRELIMNLFWYSITASLGQVFLFQFLEKFGPLTLSIITGVRKILSIALSIVFFGKAVSMIKIISLLLGTTVIAWEVCEKTYKPSVHSHAPVKSEKENKTN